MQKKRYSVLTNDDELVPLISRPRLKRYISDLWQRRHFIFEDAKGKSFSNNQEMVLGQAWTIINPLLDAAMYGIIFGLLLKTSRGIENYIGYLVIGLIFFGFLTAAVNGSASLIQSSRNLINSFTFPKAALVLSLLCRQFLDNLTPAMVALIFGWAFQWRVGIPWTAALVPLIFIFMHIFACGLAFFIARITAFFPDFRALLKVFVRAWFYSSGIFFAVENLTDSKAIQSLLELNPAFQFLRALRGLALYGELPSIESAAYLAAVSIFTFIFGLIFFWRAEARYVTAR